MTDRPEKPLETHLSVLSLTTPVAMGYIPLGAVFGFLFVQAGGSAWLAILASVVVYAGAAQYMMIPMLAAGLSVGAIALATLVINLRHVFYGLSLLDKLPQSRWLKTYCVFGLTDETYSVLTTLPANTSARQMALITGLNQAWWVLGTSVGALAGTHAQLRLTGLEFALTALFAVLAVEQWRASQSAAPLWIALLAYAAAYVAAPQHALVVAMAISVLAGVFWPAPKSSQGPAQTDTDRGTP